MIIPIEHVFYTVGTLFFLGFLIGLLPAKRIQDKKKEEERDNEESK